MKTKLGLTLAAFGLVGAGLASAATISTTLDVSATVIDACNSLSTTPVNFGTYSNGAINAEGTISVNCLEGTNYWIQVDAGQHFNSGSHRAQMWATPNNGSIISYLLYQDAAHSQEWGQCTTPPLCNGAVAKSAQGTGVIQTLPIFGVAFSPDPVFSPAPQPGAYGDKVTVTVMY